MKKPVLCYKHHDACKCREWEYQRMAEALKRIYTYAEDALGLTHNGRISHLNLIRDTAMRAFGINPIRAKDE